MINTKEKKTKQDMAQIKKVTNKIINYMITKRNLVF